jgi:Uma2 family endonuclease
MPAVAECQPAGKGQLGPSRARGIVLHAVAWDRYEQILTALGECHVRLTYDRGTLELMAPLYNHEWLKRRLMVLIFALGKELNIPVQGAGSTTLRRQDVQRGLEPDEGFYIRHAPQMTGMRELDLTRDPPPDLAVEIDWTGSSVDRMGIYAALGVPEVWRYEGGAIAVHELTPEGRYALRQQSLSFPDLPLAEVMPLFEESQLLNEIDALDHFRAWVRRRLLPDLQPPAGGA